MKKVMIFRLALVVLVLLTVSVASASVNWTRPVANGDGDWGTSANWDTAPSATTDYTYLGTAASNADIEVTDSETYGYRMVLGHTSSVPPVLTIKNGGSLSQGTYSTGSHSYVGRNSGGDGHMIIEAGGTFSTNAKLYIGAYSGSEGTVDVSGTLDLSAGYGKLCLGESTTNGTGYLNVLDGGVVKLSSFSDTYMGFELSAMSSTSEIDILDSGKMVADGNSLAGAQAIIDTDQVYGNGVLGNVVASYDSVEDETTITAIPLTYTLTVNNGTGDGDYEEDSINNIVADAPATEYSFDAWTGDTAYVANVNSSSTTVTMPAAAVTVTATYSLNTYTLTVTNGTGDGSYAKDSVNNITADAPASGYVFDVWTGDTAYVANVNSSSTTVTMPSGAVSVTATYKATNSTWTRLATSGAGDWSTAGNWDTEPAATTEYTYTGASSDPNLAEIQVTDSETYGYRVIHGSDSLGTESPVLRIKNGGTLSQGTYSTGAHSYVGRSNQAKMIIETGGTFSTNTKLYIGAYSGSEGTVDVAGTLDLSGGYGKLCLGESTTNGTGYLNVLEGGVVKLSSFSDTYKGFELSAMSTTSMIDIIGSGEIVADGNSLTYAQDLIDTDQVYGNGLLGYVVATYDPNQDETKITAIPANSTWTRPLVDGYGDWSDSSNWASGAVPSTLTEITYTAVSFNLGDVHVTDAQTYGDRLIHGSFSAGTESGVLRIEDGGSLSQGVYNTGKHSYIGKSCTAKMIIEEGGSFSTNAKLYIGAYPGSVGTVDVAGVLDMSNGYGELNFGDTYPTTATGYLNVLDGGIVKVNNFGSGLTGIQQPLSDTSIIDIRGTGKIVCEGNDLSDANDLIDGGRVAGDGILGNVVATYDAIEDETTITAVPVQVISTWTRPSASGAGNWNSSSNWENSEVPSATTDDTYTADANNLAEIQVSDTQTFGNRLFHGSNSLGMTSPVLRIQNGGSLSMGTDVANDQHSYIGYTNSAEMIVESGGTFTTIRKLYLGKNDSVTGTVDIAGTFDISDANGLLVLGSAGTGFVNVLDGGVLKVHTFEAGSSGIFQPIKAGSVLDIEDGGEVVADGNSLIAAEALIAGGRIAGDSLLGNVEATYDGTADETTITVIAEPSPYSVWARDASSGVGDWDTAANWDGGVPTSSTEETYTGVDSDLAEIQVTDTQTYGDKLIHGSGSLGTESPVLRIKNGGTLSQGVSNNWAHSYVGRSNTAEMVIESGGTFSTNAKLYISQYSGSVGTVDVAGTLDLSAGYGKLCLGGTATNGTGYLNVLDGGIVKLSSFSDGYKGFELSAMSATSMIDIQGTGEIVADGNSLSHAQAIIDTDQVSGDGILGNVIASYDATEDETTITADNKFTLIDDGDPNVVIVIGADATTVEEYAADELQTYLYKISGATVSIVTQGAGTIENAIVIGTPDTCDYVDDSGLIAASSMSRDGLLIKTIDDANNVLVLAGEYPQGALYATYAFLEEHLGCRWYFPGDDGEYVPSITTIEIGHIDDTQEPAMPFRGINPVATTVYDTEISDWMGRNRMNNIRQIVLQSYHRARANEVIKKGIFFSNDSLFSQWLTLYDGDLFADHPEYYALIDGVRTDSNANYCLSNLDFVELMADIIEDYVEVFPDVEVIGINQQDSVVWCECSSCAALGSGSPTDMLHTFLNRLVDELDSRGSILDNRVIATQAYQDTAELPVSVTPDEDIVIYYALITHCARHGWDEEGCTSQEYQKPYLAAWLNYGNPIIAYTYHAEHCTGFPFAMAYHSSNAIKYYDSIGMSGWYPETCPDDPGNDPLQRDPNLLWGDQWYSQKELYYTAAKTLWDPDITLEEIEDDFFPKFYGAAAPAMRNYYKALEEAWHYPGDVLYPHKRVLNYNPSTCIDFLNPTLINTMKGYLDDAVDLYDGESQVIQDRVDRDVEMFAKWELRYEETGGIPTRK